MMSSALYDQVRNNIDATIQPPEKSAVGVGGETVPILGEVPGLAITIQHKKLGCPTLSVVDGLVHDLVLGRDFCCRIGTVIDDTNGTIQIQDLKLKLPTYDEIRPQRSRVKTTCSVTIPPRSETVIWAKLQPIDGKILENDPHLLNGVLEPNSKLIKEELLIPRTAASMSIEGTIPVKVTNTTTDEATILKGSDIGTFHTLSMNGGEYKLCEGHKSEAAAAQHGSVPGLDLSSSDLSEVGQQKVKDLTLRFRDIFSTDSDDTGTTNLLQQSDRYRRRSTGKAAASTNPLSPQGTSREAEGEDAG